MGEYAVELKNSHGLPVAYISVQRDRSLCLTEKLAASQYSNPDIAEDLAADLNERIIRRRITTPISSSIDLRTHRFFAVEL
jgi:hypothetical protein